MSVAESETWYASFWFNCGILLFRGFEHIPTGKPIPAEPERLPKEWYVIKEKHSADDEGVSAFYILDKRKNASIYEFETVSHARINASWYLASRGMAVVSEGIAQVLIPPELSSPDRKKRLQEILCLHKHVGIIEVSFKVDNTLMGTNTNGQEEIVVNIFDSGEMICICDHCRCSDIPHFSWYPKRGKPVRLMMEKAMPLDTDVNMELRERKRLQQHLSFANWHKLTNAWNEHNARQLSPLFHVPNYINLQTQGNNPEAKIQKDGEIIGKIFIDSEDTDERPHFHYCRPNGTEVMISLTAAQYLEPVVFELNRKEKAALTQFMTELWPNDFNGFTVYARLCFDWDNYHPTDWFLPNQYADIFPMPDYTRLKKYKWATNNPNEYP